MPEGIEQKCGLATCDASAGAGQQQRRRASRVLVAGAIVAAARDIACPVVAVAVGVRRPTEDATKGRTHY
jgi:hypothetical protein